jgi:hypothetical protein
VLLQLLSVTINEVPHSKSTKVTNLTASFLPLEENPIIAISPGDKTV